MRAKNVTVLSDKGRAARSAKALRIIALAVCFATVFALSLTFASQAKNGIAEATYSWEGATQQLTWTSDNDGTPKSILAREAVLGDAGDIPGEKFGTDENTNASTSNPSGFPGTGTAKTWYYTETFDNVVPDEANQSIAKGGNNGNTNCYYYFGGKDWWRIGYGNSYDASPLAWAISYQLPTVIMRAASTPMFKVTVWTSFGYFKNTEFHLGAGFSTVHTYDWESDSLADAATVRDHYSEGKRITNTDVNWTNENDAISHTTTDPIELTGSRYLNIGIGGEVISSVNAGWTSGDKTCEFGTLRVYFKIEYNDNWKTDAGALSVDDGGSPLFANDYNFNAQKNGSSALKDAGEEGDWPIFRDDIASGYYTSDTDERLTSYQGTPIVQDGATAIDHAYYKYSKLFVADTYNYLNSNDFKPLEAVTDTTSWAAVQKSMGIYGRAITNTTKPESIAELTWSGSALSTKYATGLKELTLVVTDTDNEDSDPTDVAISLTNLSNTPIKQTLTVSGKEVGYVVVTPVDGSGAVAVEIYAYSNMVAALSFTDYGNRALSKAITYGGIDTKGSAEVHLADEDGGYLTESEGGEWWTERTDIAMTLSTSEGDESVIAPNIYFIEVLKKDGGAGFGSAESEAPTYENFLSRHSNLKVAAVMPQGTQGDGVAVSYDFLTGEFGNGATAYYSLLEKNRVTGSGEYCLRVYGFDLAGNSTCAPKNFYIKVDMDKPQYEAEILYGDGQSIDGAHNGTWAVADSARIRLKLMLTSPVEGGNGQMSEPREGVSLSGVTVVFEIDNALHYASMGASGNMMYSDAFNQGAMGLTATYKNLKSQTSNNFDLSVTIVNEGGTRYLQFEVKPSEGSVAEIVWVTTFTVVPGTFSGKDANMIDSEYGFTSEKWTTDEGLGMQVLLDNVSPSITEIGLSYEGETVGDALMLDDDNRTDYEEIKALRPEQRKWLAQRYIGAAVTVTDDMWGSYGEQYNVYFEVKALKDMAALDEFISEDFLSRYASFTDTGALFDRYLNKTGGDFDGNLLEIPNDQSGIDLRFTGEREGVPAGLRLIYAWVKDQAGNCSAPEVFYLFADWATYNVAGQVTSSEKLPENTASIELDKRSLARGENVTVTLTFEQGYAPYMLSLGGGDVILMNKGASVEGLEPADAYQELLRGYDNYNGIALEISYIFDTADFDEITADECNISFKHRQIVNFAPGTQNQLEYLGRAVTAQDLTFEIDNLDNIDNIKQAFRLRYAADAGEGTFVPLYVANEGDEPTTDIASAKTDENGLPIPFEARKVGAYSAYIYIPYDDEAFVEADVAFDDESGEQILNRLINILIERKTVYVVPTEGECVYGESATLESGLFADAQGTQEWTLDPSFGYLKGSLKLDGADVARPAAGSYRIVQDETFEINDNYNVVFVEGKIYTVNKRQIEVIVAAAEKYFGDEDPTFELGVDASKLGTYAQAIFDEIFGTHEGETREIDGTEYTLFASAAVRRAKEGDFEKVGKYAFESDLSQASASENFELVLAEGAKTQKFVIKQREVRIAASGSTSLAYNGTFDKANAKLTYRLLDQKDELSLVREALTQLMAAGLLSIGDEMTEESREGYSKVEKYVVTLNEYENDNIKITLSAENDGNIYFVYYAEQDTVVISVRSGASFEFVYGEEWNAETSIAYSPSKFDITRNGEPININSNRDKVSWKLAIAGHESDKYLPVGTYVATITDIKIMLTGMETKAKYIADTVTFTVAPAEIVVQPKLAKNSREYAGDDGDYGFDFEIATVGGKAFEGTYADMDGDGLRALVPYGTGFRFVRSVFDAQGNKIANGARTDSVTGADNKNADGNYYMPETVGTPTIKGNANFRLKCEVPKDMYLGIDPIKLALDAAEFVGASKTYDGTDTAYFSGNTLLSEEQRTGAISAYDLTAQLRFTDEAYLIFEAKYATKGSATSAEGEKTSITFAKLKLEGRNAANYVIGSITNSVQNNGAEIKIGGAEITPEQAGALTADLLNSLTVTIAQTDNHIDIDTPSIDYSIYINPGAIGVRYSDITATKIYDGTTALSIDDITVIGRVAEGGGASPYLLSAATKSFANAAGANTLPTPDANEGSEPSFITLDILFELADVDASAIKIANGDESFGAEYNDERIQVTKEGGRIRITITAFGVTVNKRTLDGDSFEDIVPTDRAYNGRREVSVTATLKEGALGANDTFDDLGLSFTGIAESKDAGAQTVTFAAEQPTNGNYRLDIDAVNEKFSGENARKVNIARAKIVPNAVFTAREYNSSAEIDPSLYSFGETVFRTVDNLFFEELMDELRNITFDTSAITVTLSREGKADPNVLAIDGQVIRHPLLIEGIVIAVSGDVKLSNYELAGTLYAEGAIDGEFELKAGDIPALEIEDAFELIRAQVRIVDNNVTVHDKIYDGTTSADIDVKLPENVPESERPYIKIVAAGNFTRSAVGANNTVSIQPGNATIELTDEGKAEGKESLLPNYEIIDTPTKFTGTIYERPVAVEVSMGTRAYDATRAVSNADVTYTFTDGMLMNDASSYNVQTPGGAYYFDKDVAFDENGEPTLKNGTVYNPKMRDLKSANSSNYKLATASDVALEGRTLYAVMLASGVMLTAADYELRYPAGDGATATDADVAPEDAPQTIVKYYYELPTTEWLFEAKADNEELRAAAEEKDALVGYFENGANKYWAVTQEFGDENTATYPALKKVAAIGALAYISAQGTVTPLTLEIPRTAVSITKDSMLRKQYDGTVKFFGKITEGADKSGDCNYNKSNIVGVKAGDDVYIENMTGEFNVADTTANAVVFTGTLGGKDVKNYVLKEGSRATASAKITKRDIVAHLDSTSVEYGTNLETVEGKITYKMKAGDTEYTLERVGYVFYLPLYEYLHVLGFADAADGKLNDEADAGYVAALKEGNLFVKNGMGEFEQFAGEETAETYIKLSGSFLSLPKARADFGTALPDAGRTSTKYELRGGDAINFNFKFEYAEGVAMTITPKDVYVSGTDTDLTIYYGESVPTGARHIAFYDGNGIAYSFASGEAYGALFVTNGVDYGPVLKWVQYSTITGQVVPTSGPYLSVPSNGYIYIGVFGAPDGVDYAQGTYTNAGGDTVRLNPHVKNYRLHFGEPEADEINGVLDYFVNFAGDGDGDLAEDPNKFYRAHTLTLNVLKPVISGVTALDGQSFDYDGTDPLTKIVSGTRPDDKVELIKTKESVNAISNMENAGVKTGYVRVTRVTRYDAGDTVGNESVWISDDPITVTVNRATPSLSARDDAKVYDGKLYVYNYADRGFIVDTVGNLSIQDGWANLSYEKLVGSVYYAGYVESDGATVPVLKDADGNYHSADGRDWPQEQVKAYELKDVGSYRVVIQLNDTFEKVETNYKPVSIYAYVTISARPVFVTNIKVDDMTSTGVDATGALRFRALFDESKQYNVTYDITTAGDLAEDDIARLPKAATTVVGLEQGITSAGRYTFSIVIKDAYTAGEMTYLPSNYVFSDSKGVIELTQNSFLSQGGAGSTANDKVEFENEGIIANRLTVRHIKRTGGTGADVDLWNRVETYMPHISDDATLVGIVQVKLYYGNTQINTNGLKMSLAIKVPEGVDRDLDNIIVYVKNSEGGLEPLKDYKLTSGVIYYDTDFLGELVFVDVSTMSLPLWIFIVGGVIVGLALAFIVWVLASYIVRKSKLKKLV